jgi:hypothetical protein
MMQLIILISGLIGAAVAEPAELPTPGPVVNIVEWDGNELPTVYERSEQLPIDQVDLVKLSRNGFDAMQLTEMISQRRYTGDVSADGLIALRAAGLPHEVIQSASLHALPPNRSVNLTVSLEIDGQRSAPRQRYLYIIIPDGDLERVFTADLSQVFGRTWRTESVEDHSDLLIPRTVRTVTFSGRIPLKSVGTKDLTVFTSARPDIHWISETSPDTRSAFRTHTFDFPASSIRNDCRLLIRLFQDRMLEDNWTITGTHLECEWN